MDIFWKNIQECEKLGIGRYDLIIADGGYEKKYVNFKSTEILKICDHKWTNCPALKEECNTL